MARFAAWPLGSWSLDALLMAYGCDMLSFLIIACLAVALFAAAGLVFLFAASDRAEVRGRLKEITAVSTSRRPYGARNVLQNITRTLLPLRRILHLKGDDALANQLSLAGFRSAEHLDIFLNAKLLGPVLGILAATFVGGRNLLPLSLVLGAVGFFAPDLFLIRAISRHRQAVAKGLPDAMDLLVICMDAGLGIDQATLRVATELAEVSPALCDELLTIGREQRAAKPELMPGAEWPID